jgi:hypothetical protein
VKTWWTWLLAGLVAACSGTPTTSSTERLTTTAAPPPTTATTTTTTTTLPPSTTTTISPFAHPAWLGTIELALRPDGYGVAQPTPPELQDRRLETIDLLPPPPGDDFESFAGPIPPDVLARSTWTEGCPVTLDQLAYLTVSHIGFDGKFHTGELIVNAKVAEDFVEVFRRLHQARYPIEEMRVISVADLEAHPTGDLNPTTAFECRRSTGSGRWSNHAYGLAIDINQFHNPYVKGDLVLPELASAYLDRSTVRPGMILDGDVVVEAFAAIGWKWGGNWNTLKDWQHFSHDGR